MAHPPQPRLPTTTPGVPLSTRDASGCFCLRGTNSISSSSSSSSEMGPVTSAGSDEGGDVLTRLLKRDDDSEDDANEAGDWARWPLRLLSCRCSLAASERKCCEVDEEEAVDEEP